MSRFGKKAKPRSTDETAAVLYVRVSSEEQVGNMSLDTQTKTCTSWCERQGLRVVDIFREEGESAKTADRTKLGEMLTYLGKNKAGALVVYRIDRLSRDRDDFYALRAALKRAGVRLYSATEQLEETPQGVIVETFSVAFAQVDNMVRRSRTLTGMKEATERGRFLRKAPRGYHHRDGKVIFNEETAPLIRLAFERAAAGESIDVIRVELAKRGIKMSRSAVYEMLRNPFYLGRVISPAFKLDVKGEHPPLVDATTFHRASRARGQSDGSRPYITGSTPDFPLRAVTECETCARGVAGYFARGKSGKRWPYYRCPLCHRNVAARHLEDSFTGLLGRLAIPEQTLNLAAALMREREERVGEDWTQAQAAARQRIQTAQRHLEKLLPLLLAETIDGPTYVSEKTRLEAQIAGDQEILKADPAGKIEPLFELARPILQTPALLWDATMREARPPLVKGLFPTGLRWTQKGEIEPRGNSLLCASYLGFDPVKRGLVPLAGHNVEFDLTKLISWLQRLTAVGVAA